MFKLAQLGGGGIDFIRIHVLIWLRFKLEVGRAQAELELLSAKPGQA